MKAASKLGSIWKFLRWAPQIEKDSRLNDSKSFLMLESIKESKSLSSLLILSPSF